MSELIEQRNYIEYVNERIDLIRRKQISNEDVDFTRLIFENKTVAKIIKTLMYKEMNLEKIYEKVGGYKGATIQLLKIMENRKIIQSKWKIIGFTEDGVLKQKAVKYFEIIRNLDTSGTNYK
jgi:predicted DNA-binding ArsR family transcriptional regulator